MYLNTRRRHNEESAIRREAQESAERLDGQRGAFVDWARKNGMSSEQIDQSLRQMDDVIVNRRRIAAKQ